MAREDGSGRWDFRIACANGVFSRHGGWGRDRETGEIGKTQELVARARWQCLVTFSLSHGEEATE